MFFERIKAKSRGEEMIRRGKRFDGGAAFGTGVTPGSQAGESSASDAVM